MTAGRAEMRRNTKILFSLGAVAFRSDAGSPFIELLCEVILHNYQCETLTTMDNMIRKKMADLNIFKNIDQVLIKNEKTCLTIVLEL